jgi:pimeloyl-ACP methyl ester carboxylesterase
MRALYPSTEGYAHNPTDGVRLFYEVFGPAEAARTIVFLPAWTMVHSRVWKGQVPYFSRHRFRVVTFDSRGNGKSDRPEAGYAVERIAEDALAVMDATGIERAALVGFSAGGQWAVKLAAEHPERISQLVLMSPIVWFGPPPPFIQHFWDELDHYEGIQTYNAAYWRRDYAGFLQYWAERQIPEPHSTKQREDLVGWGLETTAEVLIQTVAEGGLADAADLVGRIQCPTLILRGGEEQGFPREQAEALQRAITGSQLVELEGCGHNYAGRDPVKTNLLLHEFFGPAQSEPERVWQRAMARKRRRALFVSSPIGLGHALRDLAVADALRRADAGIGVTMLGTATG